MAATRDFEQLEQQLAELERELVLQKSQCSELLSERQDMLNAISKLEEEKYTLENQYSREHQVMLGRH